MKRFTKSTPLFLLFIFLSFTIIFSAIVGAIILIQESNDGKVEDVSKFSSCRELAEYIKFNSNKSDYIIDEPIFLQDDTTSFNLGAPEVSRNQSETNLQERGVDESDKVKIKDGYIYYASMGKISVIDSRTDELVDSVNVETFDGEFYIEGDKLIYLGTSFLFDSFRTNSFFADSSNTNITVFDISDPTNITEEYKIDSQGSLTDSRLINGVLYFVSSSYLNIWSQDINSETSRDIIPIIDVDGQKTERNCEDIYKLNGDVSSVINVVSVNINSKEFEKEQFLGNVQSTYSAGQNLYLVGNYYDENSNTRDFRNEFRTDVFFEDEIVRPSEPIPNNVNQTSILKISLDGTSLDLRANTVVNGSVLNQYSLDEFGGNFRIFTTQDERSEFRSERTNNLFILDEELNEIGAVEGLAPTESIFSATFYNDKAFVVTFRQVDPLFAIDLSDPRNPTVADELKIPGFSNFLYPVDENTVIGVGRDGDEFGSDGSVKVSLFDVEDLENIREVDTYVIQGNNGSQVNSPSLFDYKATTFDFENNKLYLLSDTSRFNDREYVNIQRFDVIGFNNQSLNEIKVVQEENQFGIFTRSAFIGNKLYVFEDFAVNIFDRDGEYNNLGEINLSSRSFDEFEDIFLPNTELIP